MKLLKLLLKLSEKSSLTFEVIAGNTILIPSLNNQFFSEKDIYHYLRMSIMDNKDDWMVKLVLVSQIFSQNTVNYD